MTDGVVRWTNAAGCPGAHERRVGPSCGVFVCCRRSDAFASRVGRQARRASCNSAIDFAAHPSGRRSMEEISMRTNILVACGVLVAGFAVSAQTPQSPPQPSTPSTSAASTSADSAGTVTVTGCLRSGTESRPPVAPTRRRRQARRAVVRRAVLPRRWGRELHADQRPGQQFVGVEQQRGLVCVEGRLDCQPQRSPQPQGDDYGLGGQERPRVQHRIGSAQRRAAWHAEPDQPHLG